MAGNARRGWARVAKLWSGFRESATESRPLIPDLFGTARVKGCGKSAPRAPATAAAWQTPPGARPNRGGMQAGSRTGLRVDFGPRPQNRCRPGWSLERTRQRVAKRNGCPFRSGPAQSFCGGYRSGRQNPAYRLPGTYVDETPAELARSHCHGQQRLGGLHRIDGSPRRSPCKLPEYRRKLPFRLAIGAR